MLRGRFFQPTQLLPDDQEAPRRHFIAIQALCLEPPALVPRAATAPTTQMQRIRTEQAMSEEAHVGTCEHATIHCVVLRSMATPARRRNMPARSGSVSGWHERY